MIGWICISIVCYTALLVNVTQVIIDTVDNRKQMYIYSIDLFV